MSSSSHGGHAGHGGDHAPKGRPMIHIDSVPELVNRLKENTDIELSVDWAQLSTFAEHDFIKSPWAKHFLRIVNPKKEVVHAPVDPTEVECLMPKHAAPHDPAEENITERIQNEPALRTYLLYLRDLTKRADAPDAPKNLFKKLYWDPAQSVPDGAEGFAGLWKSIDAEFTEKHTDDIDQRLELFFKFCVRGTSHERLWGEQPKATFSAHVAPMLSDFPFAKIAFGPAGLDEKTLHHELEALKEADLLALLYFMRERSNTFSAHKQKHIADEIIVLIEDTVAKKLAANVKSKNPENSEKAGKLAIQAVNTVLWKDYAHAHDEVQGHGIQALKTHLSHIPAHNKPKTVAQTARDAVRNVFSHPVTKGAVAFGGISEIIETILQLMRGLSLFGNRGGNAEKHAAAPEHPKKDDHEKKH